MINNLDFKFCIPMLLNFYLTNFTSTNSNTSYIVKNAVQNFINLKNKIVKH